VWRAWIVALVVLVAAFAAPARARLQPADNSGLFLSQDEGESWTHLVSSPPVASVYALWLDPSQPGRILVGTEQLLWLSEDEGVNWLPVGGELAAADEPPIAYAIAADPAAPERLWAGTSGGVLHSPDAGLTWVPMGELSSPAVALVALADPAGTVLYAGTADGLRVSRDDGASWEPDDGGLEGAVLSIALGPDGELLVGTTVGVFARQPGRGDFAAARGLTRGPARLVRFLEDGTAYAAVSATLYRRESGWAKVTTLPLASNGDPPVIGALLPVGADGLLLGTDHGLFRSGDWRLVPPFDELSYLEVGPLLRDPHRPELIYLGASALPQQVGLARAGIQFEAEPTQPADDRLAALILLLFVVGGFLAARYLSRRGQAPSPDEPSGEAGGPSE
jgi:ligand-binding sensor domain-containing protein